LPGLPHTNLDELVRHTFAAPELLQAALTHPSTGGKESRHQYERLEFLGDRVLALSIAELLYKRFPEEDEGALSKRLVGLVRREALAEVAENIGLARHINAATSARADSGRARESMLADACEGLLGALYLDGGLEPARAFVHRHWEPLLDAATKPPHDAKTSLQEWLQGRGLSLPTYQIVSREGPAHAPVFTVEVSAENGHSATADGSNKRAAEQAAAARLLAALETIDD